MNRIKSLLGVQWPVVQAPMTYIARAELAAAVSEAAGPGMIETLRPEYATGALLPLPPSSVPKASRWAPACSPAKKR